jgi:hypothetical protein
MYSKCYIIKNYMYSSVIPATWEVEMKRITTQGQPGENVINTPSQQRSQMWWFMPVILATQKA